MQGSVVCRAECRGQQYAGQRSGGQQYLGQRKGSVDCKGERRVSSLWGRNQGSVIYKQSAGVSRAECRGSAVYRAEKGVSGL